MKETLKKYYLMLMNNRQRYGSWMKKTMVMGAMAVMMSFNAGVVEAGADIGDVFNGEVSNQVKFGKYNDDPGIVYLVGTGGSENGKVVAKTFSEAAIREMMKTGGTDAILLKAPKDGIDYAVNSWEITKYDADNNIIKEKSAKQYQQYYQY